MRIIVVLLITALVLTPALAHAAPGSPAGGLALVAIPVLVIMLLVYLAKHEEAAPLPASTVPAPPEGGDR